MSTVMDIHCRMVSVVNIRGEQGDEVYLIILWRERVTPCYAFT
jgi:hypothetical protein